MAFYCWQALATHLPVKCLLGLHRDIFLFPKALLCSWANKHRLMWTRRFTTTNRPFTHNSQHRLNCIPWKGAEHSSLTAKCQARPAEKYSSSLFPFCLEKQIWEKSQDATQTGQAKPMKCSALSACFNFPERLLNALHFFPFLLHAAAMHWGDVSAWYPKGY